MIEQIKFEVAVEEGARIVAAKYAADNLGRLELGELADRVEPKYDHNTLAKLAEAIPICPRTLGRYRDTFRAWPDFRALGRISYSVLRALAPLKDRYKVLAANPDMTKAEAEKIVAARRAQPPAAAPAETAPAATTTTTEAPQPEPPSAPAEPQASSAPPDQRRAEIAGWWRRFINVANLIEDLVGLDSRFVPENILREETDYQTLPDGWPTILSL
jgi:predicted component of type VI protein secretion system